MDKSFLIEDIIRPYLTSSEENELRRRFRSLACKRFVLWSGMPREIAENWALERGQCTLAIAMGPLAVRKRDGDQSNIKSPSAWSKYMKGASALFALFTCIKGDIRILTPPPPERFHPSGLTNLQTVERAAINAYMKRAAAKPRILLIHPVIVAACDFDYEFWPNDQRQVWSTRFGSAALPTMQWRTVARSSKSLSLSTAELQRQDDMSSAILFVEKLLCATNCEQEKKKAKKTKKTKKAKKAKKKKKKKKEKKEKKVKKEKEKQQTKKKRETKKMKRKRKKKEVGKKIQQTTCGQKVKPTLSALSQKTTDTQPKAKPKTKTVKRAERRRRAKKKRGLASQ